MGDIITAALFMVAGAFALAVVWFIFVKRGKP